MTVPGGNEILMIGQMVRFLGNGAASFQQAGIILAGLFFQQIQGFQHPGGVLHDESAARCQVIPKSGILFIEIGKKPGQVLGVASGFQIFHQLVQGLFQTLPGLAGQFCCLFGVKTLDLCLGLLIEDFLVDQLLGRIDQQVPVVFNRALSQGIEGADAVDFLIKEFDPVRMAAVGGIQVQDPPPQAVLSSGFHQGRPFIAHGKESGLGFLQIQFTAHRQRHHMLLKFPLWRQAL